MGEEVLLLPGATALFTSFLGHAAVYGTVFEGTRRLLRWFRPTPQLQKGPPREEEQKKRTERCIPAREVLLTASSCGIDALFHALLAPRCEQQQQHQHVPVTSGRLLTLAFLLLIWGETHFYLVHRLLHSKSLYKTVHVHHHRCHVPNPWSSLAFHPLEGLLFFSAYLIVLVIPVPSLVWYSYKASMLLGPLSGHTGHGPHFDHHAPHTSGTYGSIGFWDWVFGTVTTTGRRSSPLTGRIA